MYEVLESCHSCPLVFRLRREDGTGGIRTLHRNHLLPFRRKILEEGNPTSTVELEDSNQTGTIKVPVQKDSGDSSEDETEPWMFQVVVTTVCLQDPGQEAKVHLQLWLAPSHFPSVVSVPLFPGFKNQGEL